MSCLRMRGPSPSLALLRWISSRQARLLRLEVHCRSLPSYTALKLTCSRSRLAARAVGDDFELSNAQLKVTVSKKGRITSIVDLELNRQLIQEGHTAGFVLFEDRPLNWDAWSEFSFLLLPHDGSRADSSPHSTHRDVDLFHLETKSEVNATSVKVAEDGPLRASLVASFHLGNSHIKATISLDSIAPVAKVDALSLIRFDTEVKWHEKHQ